MTTGAAAQTPVSKLFKHDANANAMNLVGSVYHKWLNPMHEAWGKEVYFPAKQSQWCLMNTTGDLTYTWYELIPCIAAYSFHTIIFHFKICGVHGRRALHRPD